MSSEELNIDELELALQEAQQELIRAEQEALAARERVLNNIAATVEGKATARMGRRKVKESQWLESLRLYLGSLANYNANYPDYPFADTTVTTDRPQHNIVRNKCELAISQTIAYQFAAGDKNWSIVPPQVIDIDPIDMEVTQRQAGQPMSPEDVAAYRSTLMEKEIEYYLTEARYGPESRKAMTSRVVLGTGVFKLPTKVGKRKKIYKRATTSDGKPIRIPEYIHEDVPCPYAVNLWYFYPDDSVPTFDDAEDTIELHPHSKTQLKEYINHKGFMSDQVELALKEEPRIYTNLPFNSPTYLTQGVNVLKGKYIVFEYRGPIPLEDLEVIGKAPDSGEQNSDDEIYCEVWVCNGKVIRFEVESIENCYKLPYLVSVWEPDPATCFGFGIPMLTRDQQRIVNEALKMLLDNAGISAGPQVVVDTTLIYPLEGGLECTPWKVWGVKDTLGGDVSKAINFFIPTNAFEGLSQLLSMAKSMADEESSVPALMAGIGNPTGAIDNATQAAIFNENAQSPLFFKAEEWDDEITLGLITALYDWIMRYSPKDHIKGTYCVDVRTSTAQLRNSQAQQKLDRLSMEISQGSPMGEWIKPDGLALARLAGMHLPSTGIVKSPEEVAKERAQAPPPPPDPNLLKAQAAMEQVEVDKQRLEVEMKKIELEANQKHQEMIMKFQAQEQTDRVRLEEAQAQVLAKQFEYMTALAQLASSDEQNRQKILADLAKSESEQQTKKFLAGMELPIKIEQQKIQREEMEIKRKQGSGVTSVK